MASDGIIFVFGSNLRGVHGAGATQPKHIRPFVNGFIDYAKAHPELVFLVTRVGCGLALLDDTDMAPMFCDAPDNCRLPLGWREMGRDLRGTL